MSWVSNLIQGTRKLLSTPSDDLSSRQRSLQYGVELAQYSARTLKEHRATQMAAALTYRTIFSLIPLLVVALIGVRSFKAFDSFDNSLQLKAYEFFGVPLVHSTPDGTKLTPAAVEMRERIDEVIQQLGQRMNDISFGSIGAVGFALLIWAALGLVITMEDCFNSVFGAPSGRPWHLRITIYWAAITLGPLLMLISLAITSKLGEFLTSIPYVGGGIAFMDSFAALGASWIALFTLYVLMPNAQVRKRPAMIGALVAAIFWELGKWGFTLFVQNVVPYSKLYGPLALVPLFMFWVYMNWLVVLFGLEITYTLQTLPDVRRRKQQAEEDQRLKGDPMWLIPLATRIGEAFIHGEPAGRQETAEHLRLPLRVVDDLANLLESTGFIHKVSVKNSDIGYSLARPPEDIPVTELLNLVDTMQVGDAESRQGSGWRYLSHLSKSMRTSASEASLKDVITGNH